MGGGQGVLRDVDATLWKPLSHIDGMPLSPGPARILCLGLVRCFRRRGKRKISRPAEQHGRDNANPPLRLGYVDVQPPTPGRLALQACCCAMPANGSSRPVLRRYPSGATDVAQLSNDQQRLLVARHSPCQAALGRSTTNNADKDDDFRTPERDCHCTGYRPPGSVKVKLLSYRTQSGADSAWGWDVCRCGHDLQSHGLTEEEGLDEFIRRAKVALRIDELLGDQNKLLDFDYIDEDSVSLRK